MYNLELDTAEINSLAEALGELRKYIDLKYQKQGPFKYNEALQDPLFIAACKLQFKVAKTLNPSARVTLQDFLNYGNEGKSN